VLQLLAVRFARRFTIASAQRVGNIGNMKRRILLVDDDANLLQLLSEALKEAGYVVQTAKTGEAGLELAQSFNPDVIVLDLILPKINGFNVCSKLRSLQATAKTPIIMMTTLSGRFPRLEGMVSGCNEYISKPFEVRELLSCIENLLHRSPPPEQTERIKRETKSG
jgi:DNA-binding response OmpR family regulator